MSLPKTDVYSIAKAFYNLSNAMKQLESVVANGNAAYSAKAKLANYARRCEWMINDMLTSLPRESADMMRAQVCTWETLSFEAVFDSLVLMTEEQRYGFELFAEAYRKGEIELIDKTIQP